MAGFYGNIRNATNNSLKFDRIYSNRTIMEQNEQTDGVFGGRYVLVEYDQPLSENPTQAIAIDAYKVQVDEQNNKPVYKYFRDYAFRKSDIDQMYYVVYTDEIDINEYIPHEVTSGEEGSETTEIVNNYYGQLIHEIELSFYAKTLEICTVEDEIKELETQIEEARNNQEELEVIQELEQQLNEKQELYNSIKNDRVIVKSGMPEWHAFDSYDNSYLYLPLNRLSEVDIENNEHIVKDEYWYIYDEDNRKRAIDGNNEDNYVINYAIDKINYGNGRGYDSTVWRKVFSQNGEAKYVMLAELNSVVPTFSITADAPSDIPLKPHFDEDSTNVYYNLHLQTPWGFRIAKNNIEAYVNDEKDSEGKLKKKELLAYTDDYDNTIKYASDFEVIGYNGKVIDQNGHYVTREVNKYNGAIYFNKAGLNSDIISYSPEEINDNSIRIDEGSSGQKYNNQDTTSPEKQAYPDVKELSVILPAIGDTMAKVWDILYGGKDVISPVREVIGQDDQGHNIYGPPIYYRKPRIEWYDANMLGDFRNNKLRLSGKYYDAENKMIKYKYSPNEANTLAGAINSVHDLLGMIITEEPIYNSPKAPNEAAGPDINIYPPLSDANKADPRKIYHVPAEWWQQNDEDGEEDDDKYFYSGADSNWEYIPYDDIKNVQIGTDVNTKGTAEAFRNGFGEPTPVTGLEKLIDINDNALFTNHNNENVYVKVPLGQELAEPGALYYHLPSTLKYAGNISYTGDDSIYYYEENNNYYPITIDEARDDAEANPPIIRNYYTVKDEQLYFLEQIPQFEGEEEIIDENTIFIEQKVLRNHILNSRFRIKQQVLNEKGELVDVFKPISDNFSYGSNVYQAYLDGVFKDHIDFVTRLGIGRRKYQDQRSTVLESLNNYDVDHIYMDLGTRIELVDDPNDPSKKIYQEIRDYDQIDLNTVIFHQNGSTIKYYEKNDNTGVYTRKSWSSIAGGVSLDQQISQYTYYTIEKEEKSLWIPGNTYCYFKLNGLSDDLALWIEDWKEADDETKNTLLLDFTYYTRGGNVDEFTISTAENEADFNPEYEYFIIPENDRTLATPYAYGMMAKSRSMIGDVLSWDPEQVPGIKKLYTDKIFYFKNLNNNEYEIASIADNEYFKDFIYDHNLIRGNNVKFFRTNPNKYYIQPGIVKRQPADPAHPEDDEDYAKYQEFINNFNWFQELNLNIVRPSEDGKGTDGINADIEYYFGGNKPRIKIARRIPSRRWKELPGFALDLNTLHGWLLRINELLLIGDIQTRDENTVQGCLNKLHDIFEKFDELIPGELYGVNSYGHISPVGFNSENDNGESWIELGTSQDEDGKTVLEVVHKTDNSFADDHIYIPTEDSNFVSGKTYYVLVNGEYKEYLGTTWTQGLYEKVLRDPSNHNIFGFVPDDGTGNRILLNSPVIDNAGHVVNKKESELMLSDLLLKSNGANLIATLESPNGDVTITSADTLRQALSKLVTHINDAADNITLNQYNNYYNDYPYILTEDTEPQAGKTYYIKDGNTFIVYNVNPWPSENRPDIYENVNDNSSILDVDNNDNLNEAIAKLQWQLNHIVGRKLTDLTLHQTSSTAPLAQTDTLGNGLYKLQNRINNIENFSIEGVTGSDSTGLVNIFAGIIRSDKVPTNLTTGLLSNEKSVPALRSGWIWVNTSNNYIYIKTADNINTEQNTNAITRNYWELLNAWQ